MRKLLAVLLVATLAVGAYLLAPLWIAMDMRRAVLTGDRGTLEARVDWQGVRTSLKESLQELERLKQSATATTGEVRAGLWQRIKAAAAPSRFADQLIDRYVTVEGVVSLASRRDGIKTLMGLTPRTNQEIEIPEHARPLTDRAQQFWSRLKRVEYTSLTSLEVEMADRRVPERTYQGVVRFIDGRWKLVSVRVRGVGF